MAYTAYVLFDNSVYTKIENVESEAKEAVTPLSDGSTYRNELNAAFLGMPPVVLGQQQTAIGVANEAFDGVAVVTDLPFKAAVATNSVEFTGAQHYFVKSDSYTATAPRNVAKTRDRYVWTVTGGGSYWAWADQIVAVSKSPFGFIGSTLPA